MTELRSKRSFSDRATEEMRKEIPQPKSAPRFTLLICLVLGMIASGLLLAYSYTMVAYIRNINKNDRVEVTFENSRDDGMTQSETASIHGVPTHLEQTSLIVMLIASSYAVLIYILLGALAWLPDDNSPFMRMPSFFVAVTYLFVVCAVLAQVAAFTYGIVEDNNSDYISAAGLKQAQNGTYHGRFGPASWYCDLGMYSANINQTREINYLCKEATATLGFTAYSTVFSVPVLATLIHFINILRKRRTWVKETAEMKTRLVLKELEEFTVLKIGA